MQQSIYEEVAQQTDLAAYVESHLGHIFAGESQLKEAQYSVAARESLLSHHTRVGLGLYYRREHHRASLHLRRAVVLSDGVPGTSVVAELHHYLGLMARTLGMYHQAELELEVASRMFRALHNKSGEARVLDTLGTLYADLNFHDQALEQYRRSMRLKVEVGDVPGQALTHGSLGRLHHKKGQVEEAIANYLKDRDLVWQLLLDSQSDAEKTRWRRDFAVVALCLGELCGETAGMEEESAEHYKRAMSANEDNHDITGCALVELSQAQVNLKRHRSETAMGETLEVLKKLPEEGRFSQVRGQALQALADALSRDCRHEEALLRLQQALDEFTRGDYERDAAETLIQVASVQDKLGLRPEAVTSLSRAIEMAMRLGAQHLVSQAELTLRQLNEDSWFRSVSRRFCNFSLNETPPDRSVLQPREELEQTASIMFAEVSGYTRMMVQEESGAIADLNELLSLMADAIGESGGAVDKYIGDCVMAVFHHVEGSFESSARRAATAAQQMRAGFHAFNRARHFIREANRRENPDAPVWPPLLQIRIGIATGPIVTGHVGSYRMLSHTAIGDAVNLALHLRSEAGPDEILTDQETRDALGDSFQLASQAIALKGRADPVPAYHLLGASGGVLDFQLSELILAAR